jgi:hypothetical protein
MDKVSSTLRKLTILEKQTTMALFTMPKDQLVSKEAQ